MNIHYPFVNSTCFLNSLLSSSLSLAPSQLAKTIRFTSYSMEKKRSLGSVNPTIGFVFIGVFGGGIPVFIIQSFEKFDTFIGYITSYNIVFLTSN